MQQVQLKIEGKTIFVTASKINANLIAIQVKDKSISKWISHCHQDNTSQQFRNSNWKKKKKKSIVLSTELFKNWGKEKDITFPNIWFQGHNKPSLVKGMNWQTIHQKMREN